MDKIEKLVRRIQEPKNKYGYTSLNYKNAPEKIDTYYIENIEDEIEKLELGINYQNLQDIKRLQLYENRLDKTIGDGEQWLFICPQWYFKCTKYTIIA